MWIFDFFKWQFVDVIRWENPENFLLVKKFQRNLDEIKDDTTLIIDPGYASIFIHNWIVEAIQTQNWSFKLSTANIPFITSLKSLKRLWESNDKAWVYFIKTTEILNQKWWTKNPVKYIDSNYNFPVKLRAFWNFSFQIFDLEKFWLNYIWTRNEVSIDEITEIIVDRLLQSITSVLATNWYSYTEIDAKRVEIAQKLNENINSEIESLWLKITDFRIEDTNFDEETESLISKISSQTANKKSINELHDINTSSINNYQKTRQLDVMQDAANNSWNSWDMIWTVMWMNLWNQILAWTNKNLDDDFDIKVQKLKTMLDNNLITSEEFEQKKNELLKNI